jgi:hypothetical protein
MNEHSPTLPEESVAVHVTWCEPTWKVVPEGGEHPTTGDGSQLSVADALKLAAAPAAMNTVAGQVTTGGNASSTVTWKLHIDELPAASVAVHVTVVEPSGKKLPNGGEQTSAGLASHASVAPTT